MELMLAIALGAAFGWNGALPLLTLLVVASLTGEHLSPEVHAAATSPGAIVAAGVYSLVWILLDRIPAAVLSRTLQQGRRGLLVVAGCVAFFFALLGLLEAFAGIGSSVGVLDGLGDFVLSVLLVVAFVVLLIAAVQQSGLAWASRRPGLNALRRILRASSDVISVLIAVTALLVPPLGLLLAAVFGVMALVANRDKVPREVAPAPRGKPGRKREGRLAKAMDFLDFLS